MRECREQTLPQTSKRANKASPVNVRSHVSPKTEPNASQTTNRMTDIIFVLTSIIFFVVMFIFTWACDKV